MVKQQKDCAVSEMCHGTSMIELRIVKIPSTSFLFFCDLWQRIKRLAGSSRQVAGNLPPGFLTIQSYICHNSWIAVTVKSICGMNLGEDKWLKRLFPKPRSNNKHRKKLKLT
jgi:hypothetical protein